MKRPRRNRFEVIFYTSKGARIRFASNSDKSQDLPVLAKSLDEAAALVRRVIDAENESAE